jgi:hypothetical protein
LVRDVLSVIAIVVALAVILHLLLVASGQRTLVPSFTGWTVADFIGATLMWAGAVALLYYVGWWMPLPP